jgi:all-trans-retinol dehydrogenase (NAD+)
MFEGVKTRFPSILPILDQDYVTDRVISAVRRDKQDLKLPPIVNLVPGLQLLPVNVFDWIMDFLGVNDSMDEFRGRETEKRIR